VLEEHVYLGGQLCRMVTEQAAGKSIVRLYGEFDLSCEQAFNEELAQVVEGDPSALIIDVRRLEFIDSTGLRALLSLHKLAREDGFDFTLLCGDGIVRRVLRETGLDGVLPLVDTSGAVPVSDPPV
jgi:anti-sigma B factor antagonist